MLRGLMVAILAVVVASQVDVQNIVRRVTDTEHKPARLLGFNFSSCMPPSQEKAVVNSMSFLPDPLVFPGPLNVSFDITVKDTINSPLKAAVYLARRVGSAWVKLPCIGQVGSCLYDDLCEILDMIPSCPEAFTENGVPCQCPFNKGEYKLPPSDFDVEIPIFPAGDYRGQANLTINNEVVGCYNITVTFG